ncbi:hypothetical protein GGU11DRAFT_832319, partial [Lentinula aff. detonsa]
PTSIPNLPPHFLYPTRPPVVGAYREVTSVETLEDEGFFDEEEEDETSALALGEFADTLGVDYFGLREMGITGEFGMSSLTIPKRLLNGKKRRMNLLPIAKPTEPPPPFPPPPPLILLTAGQIPEQIGLLHKFYYDRLQAAVPPSASTLPPTWSSTRPIPSLAPPSLPGPSLGNLPLHSIPFQTVYTCCARAPQTNSSICYLQALHLLYFFT